MRLAGLAGLAGLAETLLPLEEIATGPVDELGLGRPWAAHRALDRTLQARGEHPGVGGRLLLVGLRSPVTRNRNLALTALAAWTVSAWPAGRSRRWRPAALSSKNRYPAPPC